MPGRPARPRRRDLALRLRRIGKSDAAHHGLDVLALGLGRRPGLARGDVPLELEVVLRRVAGRAADRARPARPGLGFSEEDILTTKSNLANTYQLLGRLEDALRMRQDVYSRYLKAMGKEDDEDSLIAANNYAISLVGLRRYEEVKYLLRKKIPVVRRILGEGDTLTIGMRQHYAMALYEDDGATLDDIHEAVATLEETEQTGRRVLGSAHPNVVLVEKSLRNARAALRASETPPQDAVDASS